MSTGFTKCSHFGEWSLTKREESHLPGGGRRTHGGGKRVDTNGFYPLNSHFLLFLSLAQTRDRRPLQNGERQSGYRSVSFSAFSHFTDSLLLHIWLNLRRVRHDSAAQVFNALYCRTG